MAGKLPSGAIFIGTGLAFLIIFLSYIGMGALHQAAPAQESLTTIRGTVQGVSEGLRFSSRRLRPHLVFLKTPEKTLTLCIPQAMWISELVTGDQLQSLMNKEISARVDMSAGARYQAGGGESRFGCVYVFDLRSSERTVFDYEAAKAFISKDSRNAAIIIYSFCAALFVLLILVIRKCFRLFAAK